MSTIKTAKSAVLRLRDKLPTGARNKATASWINVRNGRFRDSPTYWRNRYAAGGDSGDGSIGALAHFKADFVNSFVADHGIQSAIELGCGDGRQAALFEIPRYLGLDISPDAIRLAASNTESDNRKSFLLFDSEACFDRSGILSSELGLSLDVLYHLTEPDVRDSYLRQLFGLASRYVLIYSTDSSDDLPQPNHIHHWPVGSVVENVAPSWTLVQTIENPERFNWSNPAATSTAKFFVFSQA